MTYTTLYNSKTLILLPFVDTQAFILIEETVPSIHRYLPTRALILCLEYFIVAII